MIDVIYSRSRDCLLLFSKEDTGQLCQFCQDVFRDIKVDTDIKYDEEEKFALLNSFQQIVHNDVHLDSDNNEDHDDDVKTDPFYDKEVKTKPKVLKRKRKVIRKDHLDNGSDPEEADKKKKVSCDHCPERFPSRKTLLERYKF